MDTILLACLQHLIIPPAWVHLHLRLKTHKKEIYLNQHVMNIIIVEAHATEALLIYGAFGFALRSIKLQHVSQKRCA